MNSSHRWGGMTLAEWRTRWSLNLRLHPTLPRVKPVRQKRVLQLWPLAHHQVLLVHQGAANEVAENKNQPLGQTAGVGDNQSLAAARWVPNHPVQLMELNLYMHNYYEFACFEPRITLVGLYQCSLEYSWSPRAGGLCKPPSPVQMIVQTCACANPPSQVPQPLQLGNLTKTPLTLSRAWHHGLHPAQVVGEHLGGFELEENLIRLKKSPQ